LGAIAALPWLHGFSFSRGYDLFLWVYNGWYLNRSLYAGSLPNWSDYGACGQPFFKIAGLADGALLAVLMGAVGVFEGVQFFVLLLYVAAAVGFYRLAYSLVDCRFAAWLAAAAYVLSWFMTFTVYFQAYLSNMLIYACMPWFVFYLRNAILTRSTIAAWYAAIVLACAMLANPQVAIKMLCIGMVLALPILNRDTWRVWGGTLCCVVLAALAFSTFDIVSALRLRGEVLTINSRQNSYIGPFTLVAIPAFALSLLTDFFSGYRWPEMHLWELLYSEYPGIAVVSLAVFAWGHNRVGMVKLLWLGVGLGYALFFFVVPKLSASPWLGTSHNTLIVPVFCLSLLAGYGAIGLRWKLSDIWGETRANRVLFAVAGLLFVEFYGLLLGLKIWGTGGTAPEDLPEVGIWGEVAKAMREMDSAPRFFSLNPDWTIGLFPVLTGLPTANVIELRQRSPEYQAYMNLLARCNRTADCGVAPSALLAPLNIAFVDVPLKFFTYVGPNSKAAGDDLYREGLALFDRDTHLRRFASRTIAPSDMGPQAVTTTWSPLNDNPAMGEVPNGIAQVVYENAYRLPAYVAQQTVAIVGDGDFRAAAFERVITLPGYDPQLVLYLLIDSLDELSQAHQLALVGYIAADGDRTQSVVARIEQAQLAALYKSPEKETVPAIEYWRRDGAERLEVGLMEEVRKDRFLFVSQQRFQDWSGYYGNGEEAQVFKATAGLTAVFLPAGMRDITLQYNLPRVEIWGRLFSLFSFVGTAAVAWGVEWRISLFRKWSRKTANKAI
jgi:hypothetical protein